MRPIVKGIIIGASIAFPLGINFGKDAPLLSNPFSTKPDITDKVIERTVDLFDDTRNVIHQATQPGEEPASE